MQVIDGKVVTGRRMSDGTPVKGFVIGILPEDKVRQICYSGDNQIKIEMTAERILSHD